MTDRTSASFDPPDDPQIADAPMSRRYAAARLIGLAALVAIVAAAALGWAGPREETASASEAGIMLDVTYPQVTRAGEPAPLAIKVTQPAGFTGPIEVRLCRDLFDLLDFQNWFPLPSKETNGDDVLIYEFDPPEGTVLDIRLDARSQPGPLVRTAHCPVSVDSSGLTAAVSFDVRRMP